MVHPLFIKHQALLNSAVHAIESRGYWSPFGDDPLSRSDAAIAVGGKAFDAYRDAQFYLDQPGVVGRGGGEVSPYGLPLNVSYPKCSPDVLIGAGKAGMLGWIKAGPDVRAGICAEILCRLNAHGMEIAHAVMHTTGQSLARAFRFGSAQAQDRGLEAIAYAWREMKHVPYRATWEAPDGAIPPLKFEKRYAVVPRGVGLVIGCANAPTCKAYPGIFASLVTGNAVIVKPHPAAILPLAITVALARQILKEAGFDPNLISLLVDTAAAPVTRDVALNPDIRIIDYAGGSDLGRWLEEHARQAIVFAEKAGVDCVVVDSTDDYRGMLDNLVFSLVTDYGQTCAASRALLVPRDGVLTREGMVGFDQFCRDLSAAAGRLIADPARALEWLGAIQSPAALAHLDTLAGLGEIIHPSATLDHPQWPAACVRTPLVLSASVSDTPVWAGEYSTPVMFVVATGSSWESLALAERVIREKGALTFSIHSINDNVVQHAEEAALRVGVSLSISFTGAMLANPSAGSSDFLATGTYPVANASLIDSAFFACRFLVVQSHRPLPGPERAK